MTSSVKFSEIAELVMGQSPKGADCNETGDGFPLLNGPTEFTERSPLPVQFTTAGKKFSKTGDILFCVRGSTTGRMNYADQAYAIGRGIGAIRGINGYPTAYIRAVLEHNLDRLLVAATGSTFPNVGKDLLNNFEVNVCSPEQAQQANKLLVGIEDKRYLNSQTNQTLEEMAQAIFKSWFVDFDPVKAKINGDKPEGMDEATASLFPEKLVESELGLIPEGWEVGTLDSHTSMIIDHRGKTPKKLGSDWVEEGYPAISAKNIKSKKIVRPDTIRFIDEATYKKWMKEPLIKGDIIMTSEAPMGELYFFDGSEDFCLSQRLYGLRANSDVCSPEFLFNWLQTTKAKADMEGRASGTTALGIKQAELRKVKILTPPLELLEKYSAVASNLVDMAAKNNAQNTVLEDLRDTLLPKLLSGEIELGQAQELAEVE
ncbi:TPA: restriction endonuclease subunit S [Vibrio parahaemolyticus]|uniref:restriction endonuclease subunit S n=1 Tax=Vibrio parahaemolyticus TaxID=670 RepID=UPI00111EBE57|nr:restriction endonuclease subunit S [Vibrio parahaemolyticus]TOG88426.1 hypothetical protein CGI92_23165 [Vibrio parahaemolyticus]HCH2082283.1 restriction endonuclease subunit S [Vibrio parahaemolyticus]